MQESHQMKINSCPAKSLKLKVMRKKEKKGEVADSIVIIISVWLQLWGLQGIIMLSFWLFRATERSD